MQEVLPRLSKMACSINKKRKLSVVNMQGYNLQGLRRGEDLHVNILKKIVSGIPFSQLLHCVSQVCKSWELGCWDILFWNNNVLELSLLFLNNNMKFDFSFHLSICSFKEAHSMKLTAVKNYNGQ